MFGTRLVKFATWKKKGQKIRGCWEYSTIFDKYDIWIYRANKQDLHVIVDGERGSPEWDSWKLLRPDDSSVDNSSVSAITEP